MIQTQRLTIAPFDMKHLADYCHEFNTEITRYQWPDPYERIEDARDALQSFLDEMERGEALFLSIVSAEGAFLGSVEVHGLSEDCPELGIWIVEREQKKGFAYEALSAVLDFVRSHDHKSAFYYEADVRNTGSIRLLNRFAPQYEIVRQALEEITTDSGKALKLQGYVLRARPRES